jgi:YD repeat-containing protein
LTTGAQRRINTWACDSRGSITQHAVACNTAQTMRTIPSCGAGRLPTPSRKSPVKVLIKNGTVLALQRSFSFDRGHRITSVTTALGLTTSYAYNANNTVATITKPSGLQIQNSYDQALRLIQPGRTRSQLRVRSEQPAQLGHRLGRPSHLVPV